MMIDRQIAKTMCQAAATFIVTPPNRNAAHINAIGQAMSHIIGSAMGTGTWEPPPPPPRPAWTPAGAAEQLYRTYRDRWIENGDLDDLQTMTRYVR